MEPVSNVKYIRVVTGSPYFNESWMRGKVVMSGGFEYDSVLLRLDLLDNSLQYIGRDGREMIAVPAVKSVILRDSVSGKAYEFEHSSFLPVTGRIAIGWYLLLADGRAALYKRFVKTVADNKPYGSATVEQTINTSTLYYVFVNSVFTRIKKIKDIPDLLKDKKDELNKYISSKNLPGKSDSEYADLIDYYNSLN